MLKTLLKLRQGRHPLESEKGPYAVVALYSRLKSITSDKPGPKKSSRGPNTNFANLERTSKEPSVFKLSFEVLEVKF